MKTSKKSIFVFVFLIALLLLITNKIKKYERMKSGINQFIKNYIKKDIEEIVIEDTNDNTHVGWILILAIEGDVSWDRLKLSDNFKSKFKNGKNIIKNLNEYQKFSSGFDPEIGDYKKNTLWLYGDKYDSIFNTLKYGESVSTEFIFEYKIDENNLLDDVKMIRRKDVYSINGKRVDGEKEVTYDYLPSYIHKLVVPNNENISDYFSDIPFAKKYEIKNKPNIEELGTPQNSTCEINGEKVTLTFDYGSYKKVWNVKYNINLDYKLDYIEFIEQ